MTGAARTAASAKRSTSSRSTQPTALRDSIITAVDDLARTRGWSATTMSDVAAAAGVSRQTVYNEFGSRQALVEAYVVREIESLVSDVESLVRDGSHDAHAALRAAFGLFLKLASDEPVVKIIVSDAEGGELIRLLTDIGRSVATGRVATLIVEVWPQVSNEDAAVLAETLVRLAISHALLPTSDPQTTAASITRLIGPFVDQALGLD
jgi:AcrR family transcriptional regulator